MRSTVANIYTENLKHNYMEIKKRVGEADICVAVKANAYGHGAVKIAKLLENYGCNYFGVASVEEARELIKGGIRQPIILLSLVTPEEIRDIVTLGIEPFVTTKEYILSLNSEAKKQNKRLKVHLKVDTGMGRIGATTEEAIDLSILITSLDNLEFKGLVTHFSTSDSLNQDFTVKQLDLFKSVIKKLQKLQIEPKLIHAANSGAITSRDDSMFNMVRAGISIYGFPPSPQLAGILNLKPVLEVVTKVVSLKKHPKGTSISYGRNYITKKEGEIIATLPIGYGDGYFRSLSGLGVVRINGKTYPIVGNVCMDQIMVKVDESVSLYDEVIIIGITKEAPNAETIAKKIGTIPYEVVTNIQRVRKYYI